MKITTSLCLAYLLGMLLSVGVVQADDVTAAEDASTKRVGPAAEQLAEARRKGVDFLKTSQGDDGSWTSPDAPGISALCVYAMLESGAPADDTAVVRGLKHLQTFVQPDGGIYNAEGRHGNYETSICVMAFERANTDGRYDRLLEKAEKYLRRGQWDAGEETDKSDPKFGGAGYGRSGDRPDLSNTAFLLEALRAAGAGEDDPAMQKALAFVSRCQNLETEANTTPFASKVNDGGFYYTPAAGGTSQAGLTPEGGLRSYGSMTYAGLKSMIYAGLTPEDQRVKAAYDWIRRFYSVQENPGLAQQGLYYYYQTFAKALSALEIDLVEDAQGRKHDWRKELAEQLFELQQPNGSWVNGATRWYEGDPNLATAYSLMALSHCEPQSAAN